MLGDRGQGIYLTKSQPAQSSTKCGHKVFLLGEGYGVLGSWGQWLHLTKGQPDLK